MKYAILSDKLFDDEQIIYKALQEIILLDEGGESEIGIGLRPLISEGVARDMAGRMGISVKTIPNPTQWADSVIVFYKDGDWEIHSSDEYKSNKVKR